MLENQAQLLVCRVGKHAKKLDDPITSTTTIAGETRLRRVVCSIRSDPTLATKGGFSTGHAWPQMQQLTELLLSINKAVPGEVQVGYPRDPFVATFWRERCAPAAPSAGLRWVFHAAAA